MPLPTVVSVPILAWRLTMLAWALWLASRLVGLFPPAAAKEREP